MNNPTCVQCDCVVGCQANPKACPNVSVKPAELQVNVKLCKECGLVLQNTSTCGHSCDAVYFSAQPVFHLRQYYDVTAAQLDEAITQSEQPPMRKPLTYAKLIDMLVDVWDSDDETLIRFARAIEEAHGITKDEK